MSGVVAGIGAKLAASVIFGKAKSIAGKGVGLLTRIPEPVWEALTVVGYIVAFIALHQHYANAALKAADKAGYERRASEDAKALVELAQRARNAEANWNRLAQQVRTHTDEENRRINSSSAALSVRGPGAARCERVGNPGATAAASGPVTAAGQPGAPATGVPAGDGADALAAVPWRWLVGTGKQCDLDRAEVIAWRTFWPQLVAELQKLKGAKP